MIEIQIQWMKSRSNGWNPDPMDEIQIQWMRSRSTEWAPDPMDKIRSNEWAPDPIDKIQIQRMRSRSILTLFRHHETWVFWRIRCRAPRSSLEIINGMDIWFHKEQQQKEHLTLWSLIFVFCCNIVYMFFSWVFF